MGNILFTYAKKGKITVNKIVTGLGSIYSYGAIYNEYAILDTRFLTSGDWTPLSPGPWMSVLNSAGAIGEGEFLYQKVYVDGYWNGVTGLTNESELNIKGGASRNSDGTFSPPFNLPDGYGGLIPIPLGLKDYVYYHGLCDSGHATTMFLTGFTYEGNIIPPTVSQSQSDALTLGAYIRLARLTTTLDIGDTGVYVGNDGKIYPTRVYAYGEQKLEVLTENLDETKYRNGDWINGYNGGVYTPISDEDWSTATEGAMCYFGDDESNGYSVGTVVIDDNAEFEVTITGQRAVRPHVETKTFSQNTPAVFTGLPYDTYIITEGEEVWITEVTIDDNEKVIWGGEKTHTVNITNHEHTFTECDTHTLVWSSASNNLIGYLTVGNLVGSGVTIGDYVIEWRLGSVTGNIVFITGIGSDPSIQRLHPFTKEPVVSGDLYATIKWVVIDGTTYSSVRHLYGQYSPDLKECLGYITVAKMTCSNGIAGPWAHTITYNNLLEPAANAYRSVRLDLNDDGFIRWFAYTFQAYLVADRVTVNYYHESDPDSPIVISDWIVGSNATTNYTSTPHVFGSGYQDLKQLIDLSPITHEPGDYLIIEIIPRVYEPNNYDTNWVLRLKCLTAAEFICPDPIPSSVRTPDLSAVTMNWDTANCRWVLEWYNGSGYLHSLEVRTYMQITSFSMGMGGYYDANTGKCQLHFNQNTLGYYTSLMTGACDLAKGVYTVVKTGSNVVLTFTDSRDYDAYKDRYDVMINHPSMANYTSDNTQVNHYKFLLLYIPLGDICGDSTIYKSISFHMSSIVSFDDENYTMSIAVVNTTNGLPVVACSNTKINANNQITVTDNFINLADFNYTVHLFMNPSTVTGIMLIEYVNAVTEILYPSGYGFGTPNLALIEDGCIPPSWYLMGISTYYGYIFTYMKAKITDVLDPQNNFRLITRMDFATGAILTSDLIVYEIENGIQIIP